MRRQNSLPLRWVQPLCLGCCTNGDIVVVVVEDSKVKKRRSFLKSVPDRFGVVRSGSRSGI